MISPVNQSNRLALTGTKQYQFDAAEKALNRLSPHLNNVRVDNLLRQRINNEGRQTSVYIIQV